MHRAEPPRPFVEAPPPKGGVLTFSSLHLRALTLLSNPLYINAARFLVIIERMHEKTALLIIDVQRGFINEHTKEIPSLVEQEQANYDLVWAARLEYADDSPFISIRKQSGFTDTDNPEELAFTPSPNVKTIIKHGYSAVTGELIDDLRTNSITQLDLMGVDTDQCVLATALALFDMGVTPKIIVDRCASTGGLSAHDAGVIVMRRALGNQNMIYRGAMV